MDCSILKHFYLQEERELQKVGKVSKEPEKKKVYRATGVGKYIPNNIRFVVAFS